MANHDQLLNILQAHGENFLSSFSGSAGDIMKKKNRSSSVAEPTVEEQSESEWGGIASESESDNQFEENDDEFNSASTSANVDVVVFSDAFKAKDLVTKSQSRSFMSSKVSKLREEATRELKRSSEIVDDEDAAERSNLQNDALLHKLVHTKLLSGSLNPELDLTPAQRRKALSGRVLELTGEAKLGRGERSVRGAEHNKASKRVREGLMQKQKERRVVQLEETKNLGNYHPKLKRLFNEELEDVKPKKRIRGLKMGVGNFKDGTLRLSREEIHSVQGQKVGGPSRARGGRKGRK
ncbi:hypothetical protein GYMLUDRAFT_38800 [Collybiopsis luxurians FD-317 M1]|nr:hypothetical protein GYMLUDRAFT_38800 [Collybiopsis luxurians FD-317 M1]